MPKKNKKIDAAILAKKLEDAGHDCIEEILKLLPQVKTEEALKTNLKLMAYIYAKPKARDKESYVSDTPLVVRLVKYSQSNKSLSKSKSDTTIETITSMI